MRFRRFSRISIRSIFLRAPLAAGALWRPLFWGELFVLIAALILAAFTVAPKDPQQPDAPVDWFALGMGAFSTACVFAGVQSAATHEWPYGAAIWPFTTGIAGFVVLIVGECRMNDGLLPFKQMLVAYAVIGFVGAAAGNAVYIADVQVFNLAAQKVVNLQPMQIAGSEWPLFLMTIVTGVIFGVMLKSRWVPLYTLSGLIAICAGSALLFQGLQTSAADTNSAATFLIGYGAGSTITPALFTVGLSLSRDIIARAIAAVEVVRLTIGFTSGPLTLHSIAVHGGNALLRGMHSTMLYVIGISAFATVVVIALLLRYYRNPHAPDLVRYVKEGVPAFDSPPLA